jgi:predicted nucleotide-binding protein (sugar kinase/HSP70/actin superfamily)
MNVGCNTMYFRESLMFQGQRVSDARNQENQEGIVLLGLPFNLEDGANMFI